MAVQVAILIPYAEQLSAAKGVLAPRIDGLAGKTIGIVNNSWRCMNIIVDEYAKVLYESGVAEIIEKKTTASQRLPVAQMDDLVATCDAVIVGIGN